MKIRTSSAFTLVEMLTVMAVIAILASLVVSVNAYAHKKAALSRADGEIKTMIAACENYKADAGDYPRDKESKGGPAETLDPRTNGDSTSAAYRKACLVLYKALTGDENADGRAKEKPYCEFRPDQLQKEKDGTGIQYIRDPFGNSYGYSTAAAAVEQTYRDALRKDPAAARTVSKGFSPTFDLWSTGGVISKASDPATLNLDRKRWVKNW